MAGHDERVANHEVHKTLVDARAKLDRAEGELEIPDSWTGILARFDSVLAAIADSLARSDSDLVPIAALQNLNNAIRSAAASLDGYSSSKTPSSLGDLSSHLDSAVLALATIPALPDLATTEQKKASLQALRRELGRRLGEIRKETDETLRQQAEIRRRIEEGNKALADQKTQLTSLIAEHQTAFTKAESDRGTKAQNQLAEIRTRADAQLEEEAAALEGALFELRDRGDEAIRAIEAQLARAKEVVGVIANTGMAGRFAQVADKHRRAKRFWRGVAAAGMVGFIGFAFWLFMAATGDGVGLSVAATKAVVILAFGLVAAWAARISEGHASEERRTRQLELDFSAFGPYSELLPETERVELRRAMAERFFAKIETERPDRTAKGSNSALVQVLKLAQENIGELLKFIGK